MVDVVKALIFETVSKKSAVLLTVIIELLIVVSELLTLVRILLIVSTLVLTVIKLLLIVLILLLTASTAPLLGIFVNMKPSPTNLA